MADARPDPGWMILVVRSGGFAGVSREWRVRSSEHPDVDWVALVEACPWGVVSAADHTRDQFVWRIEAKAPARECRATLPDSRVRGAWRDLVDEVKTATTR
ncbi:MAG: hypothetical protein JWM50_819 [Microbacteriaceae bacterium]|jgi:hypothetical protein|nr:hypothetical protein [Microbacteriaceae bacterium]